MLLEFKHIIRLNPFKFVIFGSSGRKHHWVFFLFRHFCYWPFKLSTSSLSLHPFSCSLTSSCPGFLLHTENRSCRYNSPHMRLSSASWPLSPSSQLLRLSQKKKPLVEKDLSVVILDSIVWPVWDFPPVISQVHVCSLCFNLSAPASPGSVPTEAGTCWPGPGTCWPGPGRFSSSRFLRCTVPRAGGLWGPCPHQLMAREWVELWKG